MKMFEDIIGEPEREREIEKNEASMVNRGFKTFEEYKMADQVVKIWKKGGSK